MSAAPKINSAVIGCGRMGAFTSAFMQKFAPRCWFPLSHAEAIRAHPQLELIALCDADEGALGRAAQAHSVEATYTDHRTLLEERRPVLVGIATRTLGRRTIIRDAARGGVRAMHIEKPLCNSMKELEELAEVFADPDLYCTYGAIRRFFGSYRAACDLAHSGTYGALREIRVNMGEGMLFWTHPHSVDLILYFAGKRNVEAVQGRLSNVVTGASALDVVSDPVIDSASIYFEDGLAGHITRAPGYAVVLSCSDAEITVENDGEGISIATRRGEDPYFQRTPYPSPAVGPAGEGSLAPLCHLVDCLQGSGAARLANAELKAQMLQGQRILFAMVQSNAERSRALGERDVDPQVRVLAQTSGKFA